ncbi:hypothetical protein [Nocardioides sp.]|uniref:hypothetical protein n=1 Tax=Nocardioides sp. TaxID=35761 RepID=UPI002B66FE02|nr:hypothetical protein [Nocardioides sp.]HXH79706.1 hypothetical protein [Nocardioides sp.]
MKPVRFLLELSAVLLGTMAGIGLWMALMVAGVLLDVLSFPFPDRTYPYETAWLLGSVALAVVSATSTWRWLRRRDEAVRTWWQ